MWIINCICGTPLWLYRVNPKQGDAIDAEHVILQDGLIAVPYEQPPPCKGCGRVPIVDFNINVENSGDVSSYFINPKEPTRKEVQLLNVIFGSNF